MSRSHPRGDTRAPGPRISWAELGRQTAVSGPVVHREVNWLVDGDVFRDRPEGRSRMARVNFDHPLISIIRDLIAATRGPVPVLRELFQGIDGVDQLLIHGSWAARQASESGAPPTSMCSWWVMSLAVCCRGSPPKRMISSVCRLTSRGSRSTSGRQMMRRPSSRR